MEGKPAGEESELKREATQNRESTAAGVGIGAPGPEAIVNAAHKQAKQVAEKVTDVLHSPKQHDEKHKIVMPEGGETALNEKADVENDDSPAHLDTTAKTDHASETASPVHAAGDIPFPALDNAPSKPLEAQTSKKTTFSALEKPRSKESREASAVPAANTGSVKRRHRATTKNSRRGFTLEDMPSRADSEELLKMIQGNLVNFPYDWLLTEEQNGNWGYQVDGVAPLSI